MKIKVTSTLILDTNKMSEAEKNVKAVIEREAFKAGSDRIGRLWAWKEANKQDIPDITLKIL